MSYYENCDNQGQIIIGNDCAKGIPRTKYNNIKNNDIPTYKKYDYLPYLLYNS